MAGSERRDYDLAVIGGGLVGSAVAWGAARRGQRVAVLDEGDLAYRASRGNFGARLGAKQGPGHARIRRLDQALLRCVARLCG